MKYYIYPVVILAICLSLTPAAAQNKVVVIPLRGESPVEPYAPLADSSPSVDQYTVGMYSVTDKKTGLIWMKNHPFLSLTWEGAWNYCQNLTTDAWEDWRLPSIDELNSIVDYGTHSPAINLFVFGGDSANYWSATTRAENVSYAWYVGFYKGETGYASKSVFLPFRCVRGQYALHNRFKDNGNGTVQDLATGLMWQSEDDNIERHWNDAQSYCQELFLGGKNDWRLPEIKELQSIVEYRTFHPAIHFKYLPGTKTSGYWSATPDTRDLGYKFTVDFEFGSTSSGEATSATYAVKYVRCVR